MTLKELKSLFRLEGDDRIKKYLWSEDYLTTIANWAEVEACRRARLITDSTSALCRLSVGAGDALLKVDPRVIFVRRTKLQSQTRPLRKVHAADLEAMAPDYDAATAGEPIAWCADYETGKALLYPPSAVADTLNLRVVREPLEPMAQPDDMPEIAPRYHPALVEGMLYRAYSNHDIEVSNDEKAARHLAKFEAEFGKRSSAIDEQWIVEQHGYDDQEGLF